MAYPLLLLLQLKVIWAAWTFRDITYGDTSSYFSFASSWFSNFETNIAWSPLYCAFYGSLLHINSDPVWATITHRIIIVLASGLLTLAVFRCLLPPAMAWLCGAWWAALPIVFETLYEVHLFALLPITVVWLLLLTARGPARRAAALAVLGASVILVRNELSIPFALMSVLLVVWEWRSARVAECGKRAALLRAAGWYLLALSLAMALCVLAYQRSTIQYPLLKTWLDRKHTLNMAQVYTFGYQQRHPEWTASPWTEYQPVMESTFGKAEPSLREMIAANPRAVWEHFAWNFRLTPSGLQLLLFNGSSSSRNPDYTIDTPLKRSTPRYLSIAMVVVWIAGIVILWRTRRQWWGELGSARSLGWISMFILVSVVPLVIMTQRPRPSYLFALSITLMALTGTFLWAIMRSFSLQERLRQIMPLVMVGLILGVPNYYHARAKEKPVAPRTTANSIKRVSPFGKQIASSKSFLMSSRGELPRYIVPLKHYATHLGALTSDWKQNETFAQRLARANVGYFYLDEEGYCVLKDTGRSESEIAFGWEAAPPGWTILASGDEPTDRWRLFKWNNIDEPSR